MFAQTLNFADNLNIMIDSMISSPVARSPVAKVGAKQTAYKLRKNKSAYMYFSAEIREDYRQRGMNLGPNEMMKVISEVWKSLNKQQKAKYEIIAQQDKQRYQQEKEELMRIDPALITKNKTKKNHVKKALSAYDFFMKEMYRKMKAADPSLYSADIIKAVSKEWKNLTETQKAIYQEKAKIDKQEKWAQVQALELNKCVENSSVTDETEEEFVPEPRKQLKVDDLVPQSAPVLIPSFSFLEDLTEKKIPAKSIYTFDMSSVAFNPACDVSPSSLSVGSTAYTAAFSPASHLGDFEAEFSTCNPSHTESPVAANPVVETQSMNTTNFELSLNRFDSFFNMELSRLPSFRLGFSRRDSRRLSGDFTSAFLQC